jgi:Tfp pilus assembly protein PilX
MKPKAVMTKRGKQIVIGVVVFVVMTMLAILLGLGPVVVERRVTTSE